ncbi:MAG: LCP family protein [Thermotogota bacterium]
MRGNPVRKPILYAATTIAILGIAVLVWYFVLGWNPFGTLGPRARVCVLCAATSATLQSEVVESVAIVTADRGRVGVLFVPADLWVKSADSTPGKLGDIAVSEGWADACRALTPLLGVSVNRYLVLDVEHLAAFLALFPRVAVSVDDPVTDPDSRAPGGSAIRIDAGNRTLTPREMMVFLRGPSRASRAERDRRAFEGILASVRLAQTDYAFDQGRQAVTADATTNLSAKACAALWTRIVQSNDTASAVLPTREVARGGVLERLPIVTEAERVVATLVRGANLLTSAKVMVAVFNGNGVRLSASRAAGYLRARGFQVSATANAETFSYATSTIVVLTDEAKAWMLREALPGEATLVSPEEFADHYEALRSQVPAGTDLVFVVGAGMEFTG